MLLQAVSKAWERRIGDPFCYMCLRCSLASSAWDDGDTRPVRHGCHLPTGSLWVTCSTSICSAATPPPPYQSGPDAFSPTPAFCSCRCFLPSSLCKRRFSDKRYNINLFCVLSAALAVFSEHNSTNYFT